MLVAGSMNGSGIFIVSADIRRCLGSTCCAPPPSSWCCWFTRPRPPDQDWPSCWRGFPPITSGNDGGPVAAWIRCLPQALRCTPRQGQPEDGGDWAIPIPPCGHRGPESLFSKPIPRRS
jgi:hypothetical protein